jgi:carbon storage regulator CsrA
MLKLTRKIGQKIIIHDSFGDTVVTVLRTSKSRVVLGIKSPKNVSVYREEVHNKRVAAGLISTF